MAAPVSAPAPAHAHASGALRFRSSVAIALSAVTGLGHVYLGRYVQGVVLFALFATAANGVLLGALWQGPAARTITLASEVALVAVWVTGLASALRLTVFTDREKLRACRDERIREGLVHYLKDELRPALESFEAACACDVDRCDVDVLFHLGVIESRLGNRRRAERYFRRCLAWDPDAKWRAEVTEELARLEGRGRPKHERVKLAPEPEAARG
ncbi:MAG TPA: hypothetical protein VHF22_11390 [Planctomycetota bacterium]|nr:hypothetical protein [Planctomycetota bacterium]